MNVLTEEGGFSEVARQLRREFPGQKLTRQHIEGWSRRGTRNAAGQVFPSPARTVPDAPRRRPNRIFRIPEVIAWVAAGIPGPKHNQYRSEWVYPERREHRPGEYHHG